MNSHKVVGVVFVVAMACNAGILFSSKSDDKAKADEKLDAKIVELNKSITSFRTYFQQISPESLKQYQDHYRLSWDYQLKTLFKTIQEIIVSMPLSTEGNMDKKNVGLVFNARKFIEEKSEIFFGHKFDPNPVAIAASDREFGMQEAKIKVKISLIPGLSDKKMTIAIKKTLYNVLELLKMMYEKMQGTLIDMYTLETITSPYKQERFVRNTIMNTWVKIGQGE